MRRGKKPPGEKVGQVLRKKGEASLRSLAEQKNKKIRSGAVFWLGSGRKRKKEVM